MSSVVIKGLRFGDSQESCFEAWKRSHMDCSAFLCGRFADSQESRFQVSKRSNMGCADLEGDCSARIHEFCFEAAKRSDMDCVELQMGFFDDFYEWHFQVHIAKRVDLMMFTKSGFRVRNVEICAVLSNNDVNWVMLRYRIFR